MASKFVCDAVLKSITALDFSYVWWYNLCKSPLEQFSNSYRWPVASEQTRREKWSHSRLFSFLRLVAKMPNLQTLNIAALNQNRTTPVSEILPLLSATGITHLNLVGANITNADFEKLLDPAFKLGKSLKHLNICGTHNFKVEAAFVISKGCPNLEELLWGDMMFHVPKPLRVQALQGIATSCSRLRKFIFPWFRTYQPGEYSEWMHSLGSMELVGCGIHPAHGGGGFDEFVRAARSHVSRIDQIAVRGSIFYFGLWGVYLPASLLHATFTAPGASFEAMQLSAQNIADTFGLTMPEHIDYNFSMPCGMPAPLDLLITVGWNTDSAYRLMTAGADMSEQSGITGFNAFAAACCRRSGDISRVLDSFTPLLISEPSTSPPVLPRRVAHFGSLSMTLLHTMGIWGHKPARVRRVLPLCEKLQLDINSQDLFGFTPLHYAVLSGSFALVKGLVKLGASRTIKSHCGIFIDAIELAVQVGSPARIMRMLIPDQAAFAQLASARPDMAFISAILMQDLTLLAQFFLKPLPEEEVITILKRADELFPLLVASIRSGNRFLKLLLRGIPFLFDHLDLSATPQQMDSVRSGRRTALHVAACSNNTYLLELLLSKGASVEILDADGATPLIAALERHAGPECASILVDKMLDRADLLNVKTKSRKYSALHWAATLPAQHEPLLRKIMSAPGINLRPIDSLDRTPAKYLRPVDGPERGSLHHVFEEFQLFDA